MEKDEGVRTHQTALPHFMSPILVAMFSCPARNLCNIGSKVENRLKISVMIMQHHSFG